MQSRKLRAKFKSNFGVDVDAWFDEKTKDQAEEMANTTESEEEMDHFMSEDEMNDARFLSRIN